MFQVWMLDENKFYANESTFVKEVTENMTTVPLLIGYIKPLFNGEEWIEGATEEEIAEWEQSQQIDICTELTTEERTTQLEADKITLAENVYMLAEIIESLLGGTEDGQSSTTTETTTN